MLNGAEELAAHAQRKLGIKLNQSTPDGRIFLNQEEECLAACTGAPMMMVDHVLPRAPDTRVARSDPGWPEVSAALDTYADKMNLTVFEPLKLERSWTLPTYRTIGGYQVWERLLRERPPPRGRSSIAVKASGLRGPRRRRLSHRHQVELHAAQLAGAEVPGVQFG